MYSFQKHVVLLIGIAGLFPATAVAKPTGSLRTLVQHHAKANGVPLKLAEAVIRLESGYRPGIVHKGNYGLMQIRLGTARAMGFRGIPRNLLIPDQNLRYGMRYLGNAWRASGRNVCGTIKRYQTGTGSGRIGRATLRYCAKAKRLMSQR